MTSNKIKNSRLVTFNEPYLIATKGGKTKTLFAKGSQHAMHVELAQRLVDRGAKAKVEPLPYESMIADAKRLFAEREKQKQAAVWS